MEDTGFDSSKLGTKEHWDEVYQRELVNFDEFGDNVTQLLRFGESTLRTLLKHFMKLEGLTKESKILDVGTGNGITLIELGKKGYTNLHGSDYSEGAVNLAIKLAQQEGLQINFFRDDILNTSVTEFYQFILDKGTFDAISLSDDSKTNRTKYTKSIRKMLDTSKDAKFVITSCNFTKQELLDQFKEDFVFDSEVQYPKLKFGGVEGAVYTTVVFKLQ